VYQSGVVKDVFKLNMAFHLIQICFGKTLELWEDLGNYKKTSEEKALPTIDLRVSAAPSRDRQSNDETRERYKFQIYFYQSYVFPEHLLAG
jgi:hypothetical protein